MFWYIPLPVSLIISSSSDSVVSGADLKSTPSYVTSDAKLENAAFPGKLQKFLLTAGCKNLKERP
jgi:hypothetical protein